jgi:hypothetical protein
MASNPRILSPSELERRLDDWAGRTHYYPFLLNNSDESESAISAKNVEDWFSGIEACGGAYNISPLQWADIAIFFLAPEGEARDRELKAVMNEGRGIYLEATKQKFWHWNDFKDGLRLVNCTWFLCFTPAFHQLHTFPSRIELLHSIQPKNPVYQRAQTPAG